ncbi:MAG: ABC transporter permease [Acidobacteriota bacterium]
MRSFFAVFSRELRAYFVSPLAWVILTALLLIQGYFFSLIISALSDPNTVAGATPFSHFFGFFWISLLFITPAITMRLIAEERRSGTIESLMTAPISEVEVVLAKFFAALTFYGFLWLPTVAYPVLVGRHTDVDWGPVASGYLGTLLIGALALAVGLFGSSFTKNQIVAAVTTFGLLMVLFALPWAGDLTQDETIGKVFSYMDLIVHMDEFSKGIIDSRRLVYYLTTTALFLFLTTRALAAKKWR